MRMPMRMNLSMYAGPMPRPVVPIFSVVLLPDHVELFVVRHDQVGVVADQQPAGRC